MNKERLQYVALFNQVEFEDLAQLNMKAHVITVLSRPTNQKSQRELRHAWAALYYHLRKLDTEYCQIEGLESMQVTGGTISCQ